MFAARWAVGGSSGMREDHEPASRPLPHERHQATLVRNADRLPDRLRLLEHPNHQMSDVSA
jgi:hypothetical protein